MCIMRVYLPATAADLAQLRTQPGPKLKLAFPNRGGHGVTNSLVANAPDLDQDELEWEAFVAATIDDAILLAAQPDQPPMRVVLSLEIPPTMIDDAESGTTGQLSALKIIGNSPVEVVAIHVDEPATADLIDAFRADPDSPSAQAALLDADLLWYDPTEVNDIPLP